MMLAMRMLGRDSHTSAQGTITITFGTACSGSEHWLSGLRHLSYAIKEHFGLHVNFRHMWAFEVVQRKRDFIMGNWSPECIFGDVTAITPDGFAHDFITDSPQQVAQVDWIVAGPSCRDASRLSQHHTARLDVIAKGTHSTGSTFQGVQSHCGCKSRAGLFGECDHLER